MKSAAAVAELLPERRHPAVGRRLTRRERLTESIAAALFMTVAVVMAFTAVQPLL